MSSFANFPLLEAAGKVHDIVALIEHLAPGTDSFSPDAVKVARGILARATPEEIGWLERNRPGSREYGSWAALRPSALGAPPLSPDSLVAPVVALASMHANGHVREAAVRLLATRADGAELPCLLLRLNDWVPEVRRVAEKAVRARLSAPYSGHFVASLGLVAAVRAGRRATQDDILDAIATFLSGEAAFEALFEALHAASPAMRRAAAGTAVLRTDAVLVLRAATSRDPVVATLGARAIRATWGPEALREVLPLLRRGAPGVRWIALSAACDRLSGEVESYLREALLDPSASVRELGRYRWEKVGLPPLDFAAFYREAAFSWPAGELRRVVSRAAGRTVTVSEALAVAVRGLAETGSEKDGPLFVPLLQNANAAVRTAAVAGLGRCGAPEHHEALRAAMSDRSTRVVTEARRWVRLRLGRAAVL